MHSTVHTNFNAAFTEGHIFESSDGKITVFSQEVAKLNLPSGNIIACDPGWLYLLEEKPFSRIVSPGSYPVWLCFAENESWGTAIACAMLKFSEAVPVRWELATCAGQDISTPAPGELLESIEVEIVVDRVFEKLGTTLQHPELDEAELVVHVHSPDTFDWKQKFGWISGDDELNEFLDEAERQRQLAEPRLVVEAIGERWGKAVLFVGSKPIYNTRSVHMDRQHYHLFRSTEKLPEDTKLVLQFDKGVRALGATFPTSQVSSFL